MALINNVCFFSTENQSSHVQTLQTSFGLFPASVEQETCKEVQNARNSKEV